MTPEEPPRESDPNRNVEQGGTEHQTGPTLASKPAEKTDNVLRKYHNCPYLGLHNDRTSVSTQPTSAHACYARRQRYLPSLEHQRVRCLSTTYPGCPIYPDEKPHLYATSSLYALQGTVGREGRDRWRWPGLVAVALLLALAGAFAYAVAQGLLPMQLAFTPVPAATETVASLNVTPVAVSETPRARPTADPTQTPPKTSVPTLTLTPPDLTS
jgi:hypothetical protein